MTACAIVADDLSGANTVGVHLTRVGLEVLTVVQGDRLEAVALAGYDAVVVNAMSRALAPARARTVVERATRALLARGGRYFCKRIDSTIRGNLGAEVEGMLSALGKEWVAVCVPSYPASGKTTVGGFLLVNGVPVSRTAAGKDLLKPVRESYLPAVLADQTGLPSEIVPLSTVARGAGAVADAVRDATRRGIRIVVVDSVNEADIEVVARGVESSGVSAVAVDPGPFTAALFSRYLHRSAPARAKVLVVAGSVTELTRAQLDHLETECGARLVPVDVRRFLSGGCDAQVADALVADALAAARTADVFGFRAAETRESIVDLAAEARARALTVDEVSQRITVNLADLARRVLEAHAPPIRRIYLTGGDMTVSLCNALGAHAIELEQEILPHASYGALRGGRFEGVKVVTKGGLVGVADTAWQCIQFMAKDQEESG